MLIGSELKDHGIQIFDMRKVITAVISQSLGGFVS